MAVFLIFYKHVMNKGVRVLATTLSAVLLPLPITASFPTAFSSQERCPHVFVLMDQALSVSLVVAPNESIGGVSKPSSYLKLVSNSSIRGASASFHLHRDEPRETFERIKNPRTLIMANAFFDRLGTVAMTLPVVIRSVLQTWPTIEECLIGTNYVDMANGLDPRIRSMEQGITSSQEKSGCLD